MAARKRVTHRGSAVRVKAAAKASISALLAIKAYSAGAGMALCLSGGRRGKRSVSSLGMAAWRKRRRIERKLWRRGESLSAKAVKSVAAAWRQRNENVAWQRRRKHLARRRRLKKSIWRSSQVGRWRRAAPAGLLPARLALSPPAGIGAAQTTSRVAAWLSRATASCYSLDGLRRPAAAKRRIASKRFACR